MDKRLKEILIDIKFEKKYINLYKKNKDLIPKETLSQEKIYKAFDEIDVKVEYNNKEKFFKYKSFENDVLFQLNIAISDSRITFILFIKDDVQKINTGGPFGLLAKRINKKLKAYHKITYNDYSSLLYSLQVGFGIFLEIKNQVIKKLKNE